MKKTILISSLAAILASSSFLYLYSSNKHFRDDVIEGIALLKSDHPESKKILKNAFVTKFINREYLKENYQIEFLSASEISPGVVHHQYKIDRTPLDVMIVDSSKNSIKARDNSPIYKEDVALEHDPTNVLTMALGIGDRVGKDFKYVDCSIINEENLEKMLKEPGDGILMFKNDQVYALNKEDVSSNIKLYKEEIKNSDMCVNVLRLIKNSKIDVPEYDAALTSDERNAIILNNSSDTYLLINYGQDGGGARTKLREWAEIVHEIAKSYFGENNEDYSAMNLESGTHGFFAWEDSNGEINYRQKELMPITQIDVVAK